MATGNKKSAKEIFEEAVAKELSKREKKDLVEIARLLSHPVTQKYKRQDYARNIAKFIAIQFQPLRKRPDHPSDIIQMFLNRLAGKITSNFFIIKQLKNIVGIAYSITERQTRDPKQPTKYEKMPNIKDAKSCVCLLQGYTPASFEEATCIHCFTSFHKECFNITQDTIQCPYCSLRLLDPLSEIRECYSITYFQPFFNQRQSFDANEPLDKDQVMEIRCVRIDGKNHCIQTWPDSGQLIMNQSVVTQFTPLAVNSNIKKRVDFAQTCPNIQLVNIWSLNFMETSFKRQYHRVSYEGHFIGIFKAKRLSTQQLFNKLEHNILRYEKSEDLLNSSFRSVPRSLEIPGIQISLKCILSSEPIRTPARGKFCTHFTCFDLKNIIKMNWQTRKWKCPFCEKHITEMFVDPIIKDIIDKYPLAAAVYFPKQGSRRILTQQDCNQEIKKNQQKLTRKKVKASLKSQQKPINLDKQAVVLGQDQTVEEKKLYYKRMFDFIAQTQTFLRQTDEADRLMELSQKKESSIVTKKSQDKKSLIKQKQLQCIWIIDSDEQPNNQQLIGQHQNRSVSHYKGWLSQLRRSTYKFGKEPLLNARDYNRLQSKAFRALRQVKD